MRPERPPTIYSAQSSLRRPGAFFAAAFTEVVSRRTWELALQLARRDIAASYRQSLLGYAWSVLPTIALAVALSIATQNGVIRFGTTAIPFPAYVIIGFVLWQVFVEALTGPLNALHQARPMLARINLPKEALILGKVLELLFNLVPKLALVAAVLIWHGLSPSWTVVLAPLGIAALILLGTALGVFLSPIGLLYDDVRRTLPLAVQFGLIVTPVLYAVPMGGSFATIVHANPVTPLLVTAREWLSGGAGTMLVPFLCVAAGSFIFLVICLLGLRLTSPYAVERLSS